MAATKNAENKKIEIPVIQILIVTHEKITPNTCF